MCFPVDKVQPRMRAWRRCGLYLRCFLLCGRAIRLGGNVICLCCSSAVYGSSLVTTVRLGKVEDTPAAAGPESCKLQTVLLGLVACKCSHESGLEAGCPIVSAWPRHPY